MRRGLMDDEFFLVYQPQIDMGSGRACGAETRVDVVDLHAKLSLSLNVAVANGGEVLAPPDLEDREIRMNSQPVRDGRILQQHARHGVRRHRIVER